MLAIFCFRLAWGLLISLVILPTSMVPPRFFRVQFLSSLGLLAVAGFFLRDVADGILWLALAGSAVLCLAGSIVWHLDKAPLGRLLIPLATANLTWVLFCASYTFGGEPATWRLADHFTSGLVLGAATTAMLMGHSYLIAPAMSMTPLVRLLAWLALALVVRAGLAAFGLWQFSAASSTAAWETETLLWLGVRWLIGLVGPLVLTWMAWETARIRSTQSATGILYVVVILCYLGELTSQLLLAKNSWLI